MTVSTRKHLTTLIHMADAGSRERDEWAEKHELERFANLTQIITASAESQAKAVDVALKGTAAMADRLAEATAKSTETIVGRLDAVEKAILTGKTGKEAVEGWWTKARATTAAVIGFLSFVAVLIALFWRR